MFDNVTKPDVDEEQLQEALEFLDDLRESGVTNMYGAEPYLEDWWEDRFSDMPPLKRSVRRNIVTYWMKTFSERHKKRED